METKSRGNSRVGVYAADDLIVSGIEGITTTIRHIRVLWRPKAAIESVEIWYGPTYDGSYQPVTMVGGADIVRQIDMPCNITLNPGYNFKVSVVQTNAASLLEYNVLWTEEADSFASVALAVQKCGYVNKLMGEC